MKTPNLDRLAGDGVRMENYYTDTLCTPSGVAMLTGRSTARKYSKSRYVGHMLSALVSVLKIQEDVLLKAES